MTVSGNGGSLLDYYVERIKPVERRQNGQALLAHLQTDYGAVPEALRQPAALVLKNRIKALYGPQEQAAQAGTLLSLRLPPNPATEQLYHEVALYGLQLPAADTDPQASQLHLTLETGSGLAQLEAGNLGSCYPLQLFCDRLLVWQGLTAAELQTRGSVFKAYLLAFREICGPEGETPED
ncbi:MAG: hypothetical protein PHR21_09140 [Oscillospiraceae bacterium]|nr:hypothetical protein [Oscillospiraceae bacterium]MDD4368615.1 hypothetical protein [Oscillospiraceae bacterium]